MADSHPRHLAIVGMACRFPGGLDSPDRLWKSILERRSSIGPIPADRWTTERYYSPEEGAKGKSYIRRGGFLTEDVSLFDAAFFGISPREAENMDPQQRLLLEVVWEAFENAGISLPALAGRPVGVYVGGFMLDHMITQMAPANRSQINQYTAAGMMMTMLSNRVSHTFDLCGPSLSIDTACSSSLVAFHYACQDVWRGECEIAVVGGANVMLRPEYPMGMCKGHFLSRDGECKSFDERGDGYGRGEGAGAVVVKPLAAAIEAGDSILATVAATGTNQDGRTPGVSMPSGDAQAALIERVRDSYGIDWNSVRYVECHGTGTAIGDPTESRAIGRTYGAANRGHHPVVIGSIKSNIGHLEACAGVAGVIKAVLTLQHGVAGPLANLQTLNPKIDCDEWNVRLADDPIPLAEPGEQFSVAVNSFGYGGSNAHAVLSRPPAEFATQPGGPPAPLAKLNGHSNGAGSMADGPYLLPISARGDQALNALSGRYAQHLESGADILDVLHSASTRRAHLSHRGVAIGRNRQELIAALETLQSGKDDQSSVRGVEPFTGRRSPVFVFTGMGPQWWGMGQQLYKESATYRDAVTAGDDAFKSVAGFSILAEMLRPEEESRITQTEYAQPANFLIQIGLLAMLREGGVEPGAHVGHSVGEVASAYAAGVLSLEDAMLVSYHRSQLQASTRGTGGMLAVGCSLPEAEEQIAPFCGAVSIAAVNGPTSITLAGDVDALADIAENLSQREVFNRSLDVEVAYHSPTMDPILDALQKSLGRLSTSTPEVPLYSTVTGARVTEASYDGCYWVKNVRDSVRFADAIRSLISDGYNTFLEIGPHPVLSTSLRENFKEVGADARNAYTLRRRQPESANLVRAVAQVHCFGCEIDWSRRYRTGRFVALPNYAWQREHFWMENDRGKQDRIAAIEQPILGIQEAPAAPVWRNDFDHNPLLYLRDHVVDGMPVLPAAAYLEAMFELAGLQHPEASGLAIRQLRIQSPMLIKLERGLDCVTAFDPATRMATVRSLENGRLGAGQVHTTGILSKVGTPPSTAIGVETLRERCPAVQDVPSFYRRLAAVGLEYGPAFQTIREISSTDNDDSQPAVLCRIEVQDEQTLGLSQYRLHPTLLDACFQSLLAMVEGSATSYLPTDIGEMCVYTDVSPSSVFCLAERKAMKPSRIECDLTLFDHEGRIVATVRDMGLTEAATRPLTDKFGDPIKRQILDYAWRYGAEVAEPKRLGHWLLVDGEPGLTSLISQRLTDYGATVTGHLSSSDLDSEETIRELIAASDDLDGVLVLSTMNPRDRDNDPTGERRIEQLSRVLRVIDTRSESDRPRVYVATRGAFAVQDFDSAASADQTAVNGLARVAFNELDALRVTTVDLAIDMDEAAVDPLVREVLADDTHDEVALRTNGRFVSELVESDQLSADQFDYRPLDDEHPVLVRPIDDIQESVGTAKVVAAQLVGLGPNGVRLRVEASVVPKEVLLGVKSNVLSATFLEVVARVIEVGADVRELSPGQRVVGWVAPDLASHLVVDLSQSVLTPIPEEANAVDLVATMTVAARMEAAAAEMRLAVGDHALVDAGNVGDALASALERRGVEVTRLSSEQTKVLSTTFERSVEGVHEAVRDRTEGRGFAALAVDVAEWTGEFDLRALLQGGVLVDLAEVSRSIPMPPDAGALVRTDLTTLKSRRALLAALQTTVQNVVSGAIHATPCLDVSLGDLAWQKLPLADTQSTLVLTYQTGDADLPIVQRHDLRFRPDATYLVTGGFGGLGRKTVDWLVSHGARSVVLTGRTGADTPERAAYLEDLASRNVTARAYACDTSDLGRVREVIAEIGRELPPLRGVFHSGAVIEDQPIGEIDTAALRRVMRSKATGAWNLHLATGECELDHFVMYSSVANLVGNSRQSVYSAANGFLNGLAYERRLAGKPATSVCWGAIADVGVVARDEKLEQFLRYTGLRGIDSDEGLEVLRGAMARGATQFGVTMITSWADWARFETRGATSPRFASLIAADSEGQDSSARDALVEELQSLARPDQVELLASLIREVLADVLKSDPSAISIDCAISQLGIDSLMATDIQMMLDSKLGLNVPVLQLIGETTTRELATSTLGDLLGESIEEPALVPA